MARKHNINLLINSLLYLHVQFLRFWISVADDLRKFKFGSLQPCVIVIQKQFMDPRKKKKNTFLKSNTAQLSIQISVIAIYSLQKNKAIK